MFILGQFSSNNLLRTQKLQEVLRLVLAGGHSELRLFEFSFIVNNSHFHVWVLCKRHTHWAAWFIVGYSCFWASFSGTCHFLHTVLLIGPLCISNEANVAAGAELWGKASMHQLCSLKVPSSFAHSLLFSFIMLTRSSGFTSPAPFPLLSWGTLETVFVFCFNEKKVEKSEIQFKCNAMRPIWFYSEIITRGESPWIRIYSRW